jgi:uncharacterized protein YjiS (DUF1127 family)
VPKQSLSRIANRVVDALELWASRARERRALASLDDHLLKDVGLDRKEAIAEAELPPWRGSARREHERRVRDGGYGPIAGAAE